MDTDICLGLLRYCLAFAKSLRLGDDPPSKSIYASYRNEKLFHQLINPDFGDREEFDERINNVLGSDKPAHVGMIKFIKPARKKALLPRGNANHEEEIINTTDVNIVLAAWDLYRSRCSESEKMRSRSVKDVMSDVKNDNTPREDVLESKKTEILWRRRMLKHGSNEQQPYTESLSEASPEPDQTIMAVVTVANNNGSAHGSDQGSSMLEDQAYGSNEQDALLDKQNQIMQMLVIGEGQDLEEVQRYVFDVLTNHPAEDRFDYMMQSLQRRSTHPATKWICLETLALSGHPRMMDKGCEGCQSKNQACLQYNNLGKGLVVRFVTGDGWSLW